MCVCTHVFVHIYACTYSGPKGWVCQKWAVSPHRHPSVWGPLVGKTTILCANRVLGELFMLSWRRLGPSIH